MYKKLFSVTLISIFLVTLVFGSVFAQGVSGPVAECEITREMEVGRWKVGNPWSIMFVLFRDNNNDGEWTTSGPDERVSSAVFPTSIGGITVRDADKIIIPQSAQDTDSTFGIDEGDTLPPNWAAFCLLNIITTVVNWIFTFLIVVAVALIAIAGFFWMTAGASPERQKKAGGMIMAAVIGIAIALLARAIPALVVGILA